MKKISRLIHLLPKSRLDDFPNHAKGDLATGILSNWTAAWHPLLISAAGSAPVVFGADKTSADEDGESADEDDEFDDLSVTHFETDEDLSGPATTFDADFWKDSLVFVPEITLERIAEGFAAKAVGENARLVTGMTDRAEIIERSFGLVELPPPLQDNPAQSADRVQEFYGLAYAYLQIQLLTRKIRYSSNLDQAAFDQKLVEAANAFAASDTATSDAAISACYDLLLEEKNNYYPVQSTLIDLVLTTPKTLGARFDQELDSQHNINFLMTGETLDAVQDSAAEKLKAKLSAGTGNVIGGNDTELPDTLLSPETTLRQLKRGLSKFHETFDYDISIFMRRRFGLMSSLPNILDQLNFNGAMHTSLDGGKFPTGSFGTIRWAGDAEASMLSKAEIVLDVSDPATMLNLGVRIGKQIDSAHEATCTFAHWPGRSHTAYADLITVAARSKVLGEFMTLDDHFDTLYDPGYADNFTSEEYAAPFLHEAIGASSEVTLTRFVNYWRQYYRLHVIQCLIAQWCAALLVQRQKNIRQTIQPWTEKCEAWQQQLESFTADWNHKHETETAIDAELAAATDDLMTQFSQALSNPEASAAPETCLINPVFFTRRLSFSTPTDKQHEGVNKIDQPYSVQQIADGEMFGVTECRGSSVTPIRSGDGQSTLQKQPSVLEGTKLQNEFFVATIDRATGALTSILYHGQRGNRASQRLICQDPRSREPSQMICDSLESKASNILSGEIKTTGRIVVGEKTVANFTQVFTLARGQRILGLEIEIQPTIELGDSKTKYFGHRLAWRDEANKIFGSDQFVRTEIYAPKIQSPNFIDIENLDYTLSLLPGGLPYHERIDRRQLDTLLIVANENRRSFKLGIGLDLKYPLKSAIDYACPALTTKINGPVQRQWFHLDRKNVLVTYASPCFSDVNGEPTIEMRLQETHRRGGEVTLFSPFKMSEVHRTNFHGDIIETLHNADDGPVSKIKLSYAAADFFQIRIVPASEPTV